MNNPNEEISKESHNAAIRLMKAYQDQEKRKEDFRRQSLEEERQKRIKECGENGGHHFYPTGGKYSSSTQMSCDCGKTID